MKLGQRAEHALSSASVWLVLLGIETRRMCSKNEVVDYTENRLHLVLEDLDLTQFEQARAICMGGL